MFRTKHNIDTNLVNFFISRNSFDHSISNALIEWYGALDDKDHQKTRDKAIAFLKELSSDVLSVIDYPTEDRINLVGVFEPLERLLRTAISLKDVGSDEPENVRDHLSHTVRMVLFSNFIFYQYKFDNKSTLIKQLFVAAIFHDIAYPLEKIKKVAQKLGDATFKHLLNSSGKIEIELDNPDDLLEMLNFFGIIISNFEDEISRLRGVIRNLPQPELKSKHDNEIVRLKLLNYKLKHIYKEILFPAIAGEGLFDSSHSISSIVLFLRPIIKNWRDSKTYHKLNFDTISDICLSMAYHDRKNDPQKLKCKFPEILSLMRIADELQEWDRERDSYIKDVSIQNDSSSILNLRIQMKDKSLIDLCNPVLAITHKIKGILPVNINGTIIIQFEFPKTFKDTNKLIKSLKVEHITPQKFSITGPDEAKCIDLLFTNSLVKIVFK